jgi:hypothetical protein
MASLFASQPSRLAATLSGARAVPQGRARPDSRNLRRNPRRSLCQQHARHHQHRGDDRAHPERLVEQRSREAEAEIGTSSERGRRCRPNRPAAGTPTGSSRPGWRRRRCRPPPRPAEVDAGQRVADLALERTDPLEDPLRVALPESHPLASAECVDMRELDHEPWIAGREGSFCHLVVIHSTRAAGYEPRLAHITNDFDVSYALVRAGAGIGLVPELAGPPPPGVVVRPIAGAPPSRRIYAAVRAGSGARPAVAAMLAALTARGSRAPSRASSPAP